MVNLNKLANFFKMRHPWRSSFDVWAWSDEYMYCCTLSKSQYPISDYKQLQKCTATHIHVTIYSTYCSS